MSVPTDPTDLTGKKIGSWYVVAYAGVRDRLHCWRCMCRSEWFLHEKVVAERDILDKKLNTVLSWEDWTKGWEENLSGWIFGEWTVIGPASQSEARDAERPALWRCRCVCGAERDITQSNLTERRRTLSCGCRPDAEVRAELDLKERQALQGFGRACMSARRYLNERDLDKNWTPAMERALRGFQPACVNCGATEDLTTHHVQPLSRGHGLKPGNAVRLCRACNSFIGGFVGRVIGGERDIRSPNLARKVETAAAQFKEFWENGCATLEACTTAPSEETPQALDPALIALLRAVECDEDNAIPALASWLEARGDLRATAIKEMVGIEMNVTEIPGEASKIIYCLGSSWMVIEETGEALVQRIEEFRKQQQSDEVWQRLGLSFSQRDTLKQYLGINPLGVAATIEEIAQSEARQVQTIRNRIDLAIHRLGSIKTGSTA